MNRLALGGASPRWTKQGIGSNGPLDIWRLSRTKAAWPWETGAAVGISENGAIDPVTGYPEGNAALWELDGAEPLGRLLLHDGALYGTTNR